MTGEFREDLEPTVIRAEMAITALLQQAVPTVRLRRIGPIDINAPSWSCWIITDTDAERERLADDHVLLDQLGKVAAASGFAPDTFTVQSQETVDRDFKGSWFYAMR